MSPHNHVTKVKQMESIKQILRLKGIQNPVEDMEIGDHYKISADNTHADMDLAIEKIRANEISVAHYRKQYGDLMRDPEIVFQIRDGDWIPIEYTQDPGIYQRDENGLSSVRAFAKTWDRNLRKQGFVEEAETKVTV